MVKKDIKKDTGQIIDVDFATNFKSDYYAYGMDVIENRALPDIRDGLKPVHRAILIEMITSHITSSSKNVKVAKITGAVIGKWHPHGDSSVEDALANMAAPWMNSMPSIQIKGNGGSVYGDGHAAGRYIEARLSPTGDAYGHNLKKGIVPYTPNFDETETMPEILPAQLPYLLINGTQGIAVGLSSSIPTHNPIEVINTIIQYIKHPKLTVDELMETMPGPDFPTYGEIINKSELAEIYTTGKGRIRVRGKIRYQKSNHTLHVYEIPFTSSGSMDTLVEEITRATLETVDKNNKKRPPKISGITEVRNHSGKAGIDITITLKRGVSPDAMINELFAKTKLETTLKYDFYALNNRRAKRYGIKEYFKEYTAYQHYIVINEYTILNQELTKRLEVIRGLMILQKVIDEVVASAKNSKSKAELRDVLMTGKVLDGVDTAYHQVIKSFRFTELQAEHIANLPIYKISKMDYQALIDEGKDIIKQQKVAESIINDVKKRKTLIVKRLESELKKLPVDDFKRKTELLDEEISSVSKLEIPETPLFVGMDKYQYLRIEEKPFDDAMEITNKSRIGFIDNIGVCWNVHMENEKPTKNNGTLVNQYIPNAQTIVGWSTALNDDELHYGLFIYQDGNMRLTDMRKYMTKSKSTKVASGKSDILLSKFVDVPKDTQGIIINGQTFALDAFSVNGVSGHGKHMINAINPDEPLNVEFITDISHVQLDKTTTSKSKSIVHNDGVVYFDGSDTMTFDWSESQPSHDALFAISYPDLLKSKLLFVHNDGTAKVVDGSVFKVATKRTSIVADKKGATSIFIGLVPDTLIGHYADGATKRIKTELISNQGKTGGGVRALYSTKHQLLSVEDGINSELECVSLATQPK